jgi:hypothetical protein
VTVELGGVATGGLFKAAVFVVDERIEVVVESREGLLVESSQEGEPDFAVPRIG